MIKLWANEKGETVGVLGVLLLAVLVVVLLVAGFIAYKHFHKSAGIVNGYVPTVSTVATNNSNTASKTAGQSQTSASNTAASATTVVKFTQLNVQITVPSSIKDLIYLPGTTKTTPAATTAILSTTTLSGLDSACGIDASKTPAAIQGIGELYEYAGTYTATNNPDKTSVWSKQFPNFYIAYNAPASSCSKTVATNTAADADAATLKTALSTMTTISQ